MLPNARLVAVVVVSSCRRRVVSSSCVVVCRVVSCLAAISWRMARRGPDGGLYLRSLFKFEISSQFSYKTNTERCLWVGRD